RAGGIVLVCGGDAAAGDGHAGVPAADRLAPPRPEFLDELCRQFGLGPHAIAAGPAPLRPIVRSHTTGQHYQDQHRSPSRHGLLSSSGTSFQLVRLNRTSWKLVPRSVM